MLACTSDDLEVNKLYTMIRGDVMSYGSRVHLLEIPSEYGFQSYLFEELVPYEDEQSKKKYSEWFKNALDEAEMDIQEGRCCPADEVMERLHESIAKHS